MARIRILGAGLVVLAALVLISASNAGSEIERIWALRLSPGGKVLAVIGDSGVTLYDARSGHRIAAAPARLAAFSADGRVAALAGWGSVEVLDLPEGRRVRGPTALPGKVNDAAFSPDGGRLALAHDGGQVTVWELAGGRLLVSFTAHAGDVDAVSFSPDGELLATGGAYSGEGRRGHRIHFWDAATGQQRQTLEGSEYTFVRGLSFSPDGSLLVVTGPSAIWEVRKGKSLGSLELQSGLAYNSPSFFSPDGATVVGNHTGGWSHSVRLIDVGTGKDRLVLPEAPGWMWAAAYAEDGRTLVTADREGTITEWDAGTGRSIRTRRVISRNPLPTRWWILAGAVTAWSLVWGSAFPGRGAREGKARPAWIWLTLVAGVLLISGGFLHWVVMGEAGEGPDPIGFLGGMALLQFLAGLGLLGVAARLRPGWRPFAAGLLVLGGTLVTTVGLLGGAIASV